MKILLKNCRLIPELTEGFDGHLADVLFDESTILEIGHPGGISAADCEVIDIAGCTLLPGFFDLHAHLYLTEMNLAVIDTKEMSETCFDVYTFAREYLRQGYTTIRDAGGPFNVVHGLKTAQKKGIFNIPDLISSGHAITPTESGNTEYSILYSVADGADEFRKAARKELEAGNDVIKVMATGAFLNESGDPGQTIVTEDEIKALVEVASMKGTYVMAHTHGVEGIKRCIRAGVRTVEHCCFIDDEAIEMLRDNDKCFMVPTGTVGITCEDDDMNDLLEGANEKNAIYENLEKACVNKAYRAGLKLGFGSDADYKNFSRQPGLEFLSRTDYYDFEYLDILLQATRNSAEIAGMIDKKGTIKAGKNAELVVVEGNPDEDIYVMKKKPRYVFFHGEIIKN